MADRQLKLPVEIIIKRSRYTKRYHLRIVGGNHAIRFSSQVYFSHTNAVRAALNASADLGLPVREDGDVVSA